MTVWWSTLVITFILCFIAQNISKRKKTINGEIKYLPNLFFSICACGVLVLVSAFRNGVGDTGTYRGLFDAAPSSIKEFFQVIPLEDEWGFTLYYTLIKEFISDKSQWFIIISAVVTLVSIFIVFYRYSEYIELAIFYFITMGCYLVTMNGIRQYLVSAILFLAFPWIIKKKWYLYIPLVLILSTCHVSALIFLIIYFVGNKKAWGGWTKTIIVLGVGLFITYPVTGPMIADLLGETQYGHYGGALISEGSGANVIRIFVYAVPVILSYMGRKNKKISEKFGYNLIVNLSVLNLIFMLLANKYWLYARFNMYFNSYAILLLCWEVKYLFRENNRKIVYISSIILFAIYYWYDMAVSLGYGANYVHFITTWR